MNYDELMELANQISDFDKLTSRKLFTLIFNYLHKDNEEDKKDIESKIRLLIFNKFMSSIDRKSKVELYNLNINIQEESHIIEYKCPTWFISSYGAKKYSFQDNQFFLEETIPREYKKGFILDGENASNDAINFYNNNQLILDRISGYMDRKEEIITNDYIPKKNVNREFTEKLIDYIGFRRINDKSNVSNIQKR